MGRGSRPQVYVVVLNWNNYQDSRECLESLRQATHPDLKVIFVDNGSRDRSGERLQAEFGEFIFIYNEENLGFARGCNVGIRAALEDPQCGYVLLLNNDAVVTPAFLDEAVTRMELDESIGLAGGKILYSHEPNRIWYAGGHMNRWFGRPVVRGYHEIDRGQYDEAADTSFVTGALMLIRREVLERVGLLPEEYFFGVEEYDYSIAVKRAGYRLLYVPELTVYHKADGSHSNDDPKFVYNSYRNKLILQEKYLPKGTFTFWKLIFRCYGEFLAGRVWKRLREQNTQAGEKRVPYFEFKFALRQALRDHGKNRLSEETLRKFDEELKRQVQLPERN
ncbi:MAG TPA: glycosyltransferase family 2 protein [Blastocatellia bacterium]|nr:glycosyltransferase family 2 protein [Blastocatellia bacterium]